MKPSYTFNTDLALVLLFCLAVNIPYFNPTFLVAHDTRNIYALFHYFYNHFVWHGEIPRWLPYGEYGYGTLWYQISNFSPATYLLGLAGWLAGIRDTLLLFKLSVLAEQLIFVLGLHLLSGRLYQCRFTRLAVCVAGAGSVIWHWQLYWDLRLYYLIPLALYFYHRFLTERLPWAFWAALLTMLMSLVGGLAYWAPVYLLLFVVLNAVLLPVYLRSFSSLAKPGWKGIAAMALFAVAAISLWQVYATCLEGLHNYHPGRSQENMQALLKSFLTYSPPVWGLLHSFLDGTIPNPEHVGLHPDDITLYVGLLAVAGLGVAIINVRDRWFMSLAAAMASVFLVSGSGLVSWVAYHAFPGMNLFRHLSLLLETGKLLLLLASGYGMEIIFRKLREPDCLKDRFSLFHLGSLLLALLFIIDMAVSFSVHRGSSWTSAETLKSLLPAGGFWIIVRFAVWGGFAAAMYYFAQNRKSALPPGGCDAEVAGVAADSGKARLLPLLLIMVTAVDLATFQLYHWENRNKGYLTEPPRMEPFRFVGMRTEKVPPDSLQKGEILWNGSPGAIFLAYYANIFNYDPCAPVGRVDLFPGGMHRLLTARGTKPHVDETKGFRFYHGDLSLNRVIGCETGKLRIVRKALFASSDGQAQQLVRDTNPLELTAVLKGSPPQGLPLRNGAGEYFPAYAVKGFSANRLDIELNVPPGGAGWLVYADSWDKHWKAFVNGGEVPVYEAYLAFKAIFVNEGASRVVFEHRNGLQRYATNALIALSILFAFCGLCWLARLLLRDADTLT